LYEGLRHAVSLVVSGWSIGLRCLDVLDNPLKDLSLLIWLNLNEHFLEGFPKEQLSFHAGSLIVEGITFDGTRVISITPPPLTAPGPISPLSARCHSRPSVRWASSG